VLVTPHPSASNVFERMLGEAPLGPKDACKRYAAAGRKRLNASLAKEAAESRK
jgi:metallo-beta-lactamase class B